MLSQLHVYSTMAFVLQMKCYVEYYYVHPDGRHFLHVHVYFINLWPQYADVRPHSCTVLPLLRRIQTIGTGHKYVSIP